MKPLTDTEKKIAEIREALEKATLGPWTVQGFSVRKSDGYMIRQERPRAAAPEAWEQIDERYAADARLIANAPEWLRFLIQAVEMYRELMHELDKENDHLHEKINELEKLKHERNKLIEGLRSIRNELDHLSRESRRKWKREGDMYEEGRADAYDEADVLIRDILKECGVTVD